jgi:3-phenylpropionate/trans-cinnamate dioxygenase ferredoxin reductase subunit
MLGADRAHDVLPYFWSDLADWASLEYVGIGGGEPVLRGSLDDGACTAFYLDGERVVGALSIGRREDLADAARLIMTGATPGAGALADESTDLSTL